MSFVNFINYKKLRYYLDLIQKFSNDYNYNKKKNKKNKS